MWRRQIRELKRRNPEQYKAGIRDLKWRLRTRRAQDVAAGVVHEPRHDRRPRRDRRLGCGRPAARRTATRSRDGPDDPDLPDLDHRRLAIPARHKGVANGR